LALIPIKDWVHAEERFCHDSYRKLIKLSIDLRRSLENEHITVSEKNYQLLWTFVSMIKFKLEIEEGYVKKTQLKIKDNNSMLRALSEPVDISQFLSDLSSDLDHVRSFFGSHIALIDNILSI
jgi:hypothetical protein